MNLHRFLFRKRITFGNRNRETLFEFLFPSIEIGNKNALREKIRADNFPGDSEKERSSIVLYRETRASGYNADGSSSILTKAVGDKNDRRKETMKERITKKQAGVRSKKDCRGSVAWYTCEERKARSKEMSANNYQDHPSTDLSLSFLSFAFLIYVFSFC